MPINQKRMNALRKQYGVKKGTEIYYAMETQEKQKHKRKRGKKKHKGKKK